MDHTVLVDIDVKTGEQIVAALSSAGMDIKVAMWATFADYYSPRFVLASTWFDNYDPRPGYEQVGEILRNSKLPTHRFPTLLIMRMTDPFIEDLRRTFSSTSDVEGMRLGGQTIGGRFLEDGYVYRIT